MRVLECVKCGLDAVPVKIVNKLDYFALVLYCPDCHKKTARDLSMKSAEWLKEVSSKFFSCDYCGQDNKENWRYADEMEPPFGMWPMFYPRPRPFWGPRYRRRFRGPGYRMGWGMGPAPYFAFHHMDRMERVKIMFRCSSCDKKRAKVSDRKIWPKILDLAEIELQKEEIEEEKPEKELQFECDQCGALVNKDATTCPSCKAVLQCRCGAPIVPNAVFCLKCGQKLDDIKPPIIKHECPSCGELCEDDLIFCRRCGQELKCDKCGAKLLENSNYCIECGDPIQKGSK